MHHLNKSTTIFLLFRIGIFLTFFGHGYLAFSKEEAWISYIEVIGFSKEQAIFLLPMIGILDIIVALIILIKPLKIVVLWAIIWAFSTALIRPVSGESIFAFIERGANWILPLVFLLSYKNMFNQKKMIK
jgi:hypothetical protein